MPEIEKIIGRRLKSATEQTMFVGFPNSDVIETLPAGKPSPIITSYLSRNDGNWYQLEADPKHRYIRDSDAVKVVPESAADESAALSGVTAGLFDWWNNTGTSVAKKSGFLAEGFDKATSDLTKDFKSFSDTIKPILYLLTGVLVLLLILKFSD